MKACGTRHATLSQLITIAQRCGVEMKWATAKWKLESETESDPPREVRVAAEVRVRSDAATAFLLAHLAQAGSRGRGLCGASALVTSTIYLAKLNFCGAPVS